MKKFKPVANITPAVRKVLLSSKTAMLIQLRNDRMWEQTKLLVANHERDTSRISFHQTRLDFLNFIIPEIETLTPSAFKAWVKANRSNLF